MDISNCFELITESDGALFAPAFLQKKLEQCEGGHCLWDEETQADLKAFDISCTQPRCIHPLCRQASFSRCGRGWLVRSRLSSEGGRHGLLPAGRMCALLRLATQSCDERHAMRVSSRWRRCRRFTRPLCICAWVRRKNRAPVDCPCTCTRQVRGSGRSRWTAVASITTGTDVFYTLAERSQSSNPASLELLVEYLSRHPTPWRFATGRLCARDSCSCKACAHPYLSSPAVSGYRAHSHAKPSHALLDELPRDGTPACVEGRWNRGS